MDVDRVAVHRAAVQGEQPVDLYRDADEAERGVDEHPADFVSAEVLSIEREVRGDGDAAVQVEKEDGRAVVAVGHEEARAAEREHVDHEEGIDHQPRDFFALRVELAVDGDVGLQFHVAL